MVLRIEKSSVSGLVVFTLSGRIDHTRIPELKNILASLSMNQKIAIDLADVTLVDPISVEFLATCQALGVELRNCPAYLYEWIFRVRWAKGM